MLIKAENCSKAAEQAEEQFKNVSFQYRVISVKESKVEEVINEKGSSSL